MLRSSQNCFRLRKIFSFLPTDESNVQRHTFTIPVTSNKQSLYIAKDVFPGRNALRQLADFALDLSLDEIASSQDTIGDVVFERIQWALTNSSIGALVNGAITENPSAALT